MTSPNPPVPPPLPPRDRPGAGGGWPRPDEASRVLNPADRNNDGIIDGPASATQSATQHRTQADSADAAGKSPDAAILHVTESTRTYPCPSCGGMLIFDADSQAMKCSSCGNQVAISEQFAQPKQIAKYDLGEAMAALARIKSNAATKFSGDKEIVCQSCGGHTVFTGTLTAVRCPYCNTAIQRDDVQQAETRLPIDGVLPLRVSRRDAEQRIVAWINSRRLAPNAFKKFRELGSFSSIYLPYFSYDAVTTTRYTGMRGITRIETYRDAQGNTQTRTRTDWYPAAGVVKNTFVDVTGHASDGLDDGKITELEPWPMELSRPYSPEFVAGHLSRTYDRDASETFRLRVEPRMQSVIDSTIRSDIGGDSQRIHSKDVRWLRLMFCQLALPVWMLTVTFKQEPFNVVINGVTGEVQGQRPWSWVKIMFLVILAIAVAIGVYWLYETYGGEA